MLADSEDENLAHLPVILGPPGSGKTTVISAFIQVLSLRQKPVWVVAQSNVAVKNIVERLIRDGFSGYRLLISNDYYSGW
jgi:regulator of nonsense transcripts 1